MSRNTTTRQRVSNTRQRVHNFEREQDAAERSSTASITRQWMTQRFDTIDSDNKLIADKLAVVSDKVNQHATYWAFAKWLAVALVSAWGSFLAWLGILSKP